MRLLLDAHTVFWALYEPESLPLLVAEWIADVSNTLFVSEASVWELVNKAAAYRLPAIGADPSAFLERLKELLVTLIPITMEAILASARLPRHHGDPFDRLLVALAQKHDLILLTNDGIIPLYDVHVIWK